MIPRSSSVVVKRMPPARPGKGKAAMYIGASGTSATPESKPNSQSGSSSWPARGSVSRRFDKEAPSKSTTVRAVSLFPSFSSFCSLGIRRSTFGIRHHAVCPPKYGWQGRRGGRDGCYVPGSVRELGGDSGKNVTVGVAFCGSSRVL